MKTKSRAILYIDNKLVLIKRIKDDEVYYVFPGGSVEEGEDNEQACARELDEELGIKVTIDKLAFEFTDYVGNMKEVFYLCTLLGGNVGGGADKKFVPGSVESSGYEIVYVEKEEAKKLNLLPLTVRDRVL